MIPAAYGAAAIFSLDPATVNLLAAFTGTYSNDRRLQIDTLIRGLKADGWWNRIDVLSIAGLNQADSLINWKNPGTFNGTAVNSPTFTADRGFQFNGSTTYINTNYTLSSSGGSYSLNSATLAVYSRTNNASASGDIGAEPVSGSGQSFIAPRFTDGNCYYGINSAGGAFASTDSSKFQMATRINSTTIAYFRNGVRLNTTTSNSVALAARTVWVGGRNSGTILQPYNHQSSAWLIAGGVTGVDVSAQDIDAANLSTRIGTYLTYIGAAV